MIRLDVTTAVKAPVVFRVFQSVVSATTNFHSLKESKNKLNFR